MANVCGRNTSVIFVMSYALFIEDDNQTETNLQPFQSYCYGVDTDMKKQAMVEHNL